MNTKRICIALLVLTLPLLNACNKEKSEEPESTALTSYTFEADTIPALEQVMTSETGGRLVTTLSPDSQTDGTEETDGEDAAAASSSSADSTEAQPSYVSYDYQQFNEGQTGSVVQDYVNLLSDEENAMVTEDEADYTSDTGSVTLSRQAVAVGSDGSPQTADAQIDTSTGEDTDENTEDTGDSQESTAPPYSSCVYDEQKLFRVRIDWTPTSCLVTLDKVDGQDFNTSLLQAGELLSFTSAKALMYTVSPEEIGLPGGSMNDYSIKPGPGFVMVDGQACLTMYIYGKNAEGTNSLMGTYFITSDGSGLYRQIGDTTNEVERVVLKETPQPETASSDGASSSSADPNSSAE
ncbi:MAG: hypothetical protein Q3Y08_09675 [Butyricicoccus sp.]|nr:hypothetical protein [Butyricicoccus sp.]